MSRFLVITAFTDESQFDLLIRTLKNQREVHIEHELITGLDSLGAEREIFNRALKRKAEVDYVIRLDADMTLNHPGFFKFLQDLFVRFEGIQRISLPVEDYFTGGQIMGVHCWRASSTPANAEIVPPKPESWIDKIPGLTIQDIPFGFVNHAWCPSSSQSARFGLHRSLKACTSGPLHSHWLTLYRLHNAWRANPGDSGLSYAFYSALLIVSDPALRKWEVLSKGSAENERVLSLVNFMVSDGRPLQSLLENMDFYQLHRTGGGNIVTYTVILIKSFAKRLRRLFNFAKWIVVLLRTYGWKAESLRFTHDAS